MYYLDFEEFTMITAVEGFAVPLDADKFARVN